MRAVIPTIGRSPLLLPLLRLLLAEGVTRIDVPDNEDRASHGLLRLLEDAPCYTLHKAMRRGRVQATKTTATIYRSWNYAMHRAGRTPLLVLNDDVELPPGSIAEAERHLSVDTPVVGFTLGDGAPREAGVREVYGTYRTGGLNGCAFVVRPDACGRVDERYRWWYGDDDLVRSTRALGRRVVVAEGAPVRHPVPSTSGNQMPWLAEACAADTALWRQSGGT